MEWNGADDNRTSKELYYYNFFFLFHLIFVSQEADLIAFALSPTEDRSTVLDFTVPFLEESLAALIPAPAEGHRLGAIVHSFQLEVFSHICKPFQFIHISDPFYV